METIKLDVNKSTKITFDQLGQSTMENSYDVPNSYEGIKTIYELVKSYDCEAKVDDIYVSNSPKTGYAYNTSKYSGDPEKRGLIQHYIFRRLIGTITLSDKITGGNLIVAVKYDSNKYSIAFGSRIEICSNMMIMNSEHIISTGLRGVNKLTFDNALDITAQWLADRVKTKQLHNDFIKRSVDTSITQSDANMLIGLLARRAVTSKPILKGYQVTELCKNTNSAFGDKEEIKVWDFWNAGTNNLKPENTDLATYIDNVTNFTQFCDSFLINKDLTVRQLEYAAG